MAFQIIDISQSTSNWSYYSANFSDSQISYNAALSLFLLPLISIEIEKCYFNRPRDSFEKRCYFTIQELQLYFLKQYHSNKIEQNKISSITNFAPSLSMKYLQKLKKFWVVRSFCWETCFPQFLPSRSTLVTLDLKLTVWFLSCL